MKFLKRRSDMDWKRLAALLPFLMLTANPALAQDLSPVQTMFENIVNALTGPIGRLIAILALVASGYAMFTGRLNWPWFVAILVGVVLVFSAPTIIDGFATSG